MKLEPGTASYALWRDTELPMGKAVWCLLYGPPYVLVHGKIDTRASDTPADHVLVREHVTYAGPPHKVPVSHVYLDAP